MCFYSEPKVVADLLEMTAQRIRRMVDADEDVTEDDIKRLGADLEKIDFEISGCIETREHADLDAVQANFL